MFVLFFVFNVALCFVATVAGQTRGATVEKNTDETTPDPDRIIGVASIAGIASRNGRFSTIRGVHFYPSLSPVFIKDDGKSSTSPDKDKNGIRLSGSSQFYPDVNTVVVSARAGRVPDVGPLLGHPSKPPATDVLTPDEIMHVPRHAWFPTEIFDHLMHANVNAPDARKQWTMPRFNPFINFWR